MPQIIVKQPFKFAHGGHQVEEFEPADEPRDTTDECAAIAIAEGWATPVIEAHTHEAAPENRDAAKKRHTKAAAPAAEAE